MDSGLHGLERERDARDGRRYGIIDILNCEIDALSCCRSSVTVVPLLEFLNSGKTLKLSHRNLFDFRCQFVPVLLNKIQFLFKFDSVRTHVCHIYSYFFCRFFVDFLCIYVFMWCNWIEDRLRESCLFVLVLFLWVRHGESDREIERNVSIEISLDEFIVVLWHALITIANAVTFAFTHAPIESEHIKCIRRCFIATIKFNEQRPETKSMYLICICIGEYVFHSIRWRKLNKWGKLSRFLSRNSLRLPHGRFTIYINRRLINYLNSYR